MYRVRQFWRTLTAAPQPEELACARATLTPQLWALFNRLQASEQAHSLCMYRQLLQQQETDADLLAAILLHDIGKTCYPPRLWDRVVVVLGKMVFPAQVKLWGQAEPCGWKRPFVIAEQHAGWGADLAARAGASPMVVTLIQRHHEQVIMDVTVAARTIPLEDRLLHRLQSLDDES